MLLRTRLTLMLALGLLILALGWAGASYVREQLAQERLASSMQQAQAALWSQALAMQDSELDEAIDKLLLQPAFVQALLQRNAQALHTLLAAQGLTPAPQGAVQVLGLLSQGKKDWVHGMQLGRALLDPASLERASLGNTVDGLRLASAEQALLLSARRVPGSGTPLVLVLGRDARQALDYLHQRTGATLTLLDPRGRLLSSTHASLWEAAAPQISQALQGSARLAALHWQDRSYTVSTLPVRDLADHPSGTLVVLLDQTAEAHAQQFLSRLALAGTAVLLLTLLLAVYGSLRRSLRPLEQSIDALTTLAQGGQPAYLAPPGKDEIGRIAGAIVTFERDAQALAASRALRERMHRRQERLLRTQLERLAQATDQPLNWHASDSDEAQLRQLARVMNSLSTQLIDQHQRLTSMVQELREALVTKTRLAGLEQELHIAAQVQLSILPRHPPQDERVQLHCHLTPAREVGGDFYDYFFLDAHRLGFVIADVSGKGVPAALFMTIARTLLKATAQFIAEPTQCVARLNDLLAAENEPMLFVTLFYGVLNLETGQLDYVNAGHNPPYWLRRDASVHPLARTGGMAVAIHEGFEYRSASLVLAPGERLFLFTDGITEAFNPDNQEYSETRLLHSLQQLQQHQPQAAVHTIAQAVLDDVHLFERGAAQADDMTCMVLAYQGPKGAGRMPIEG